MKIKHIGYYVREIYPDGTEGKHFLRWTYFAWRSGWRSISHEKWCALARDGKEIIKEEICVETKYLTEEEAEEIAKEFKLT